MNRVVDKLKFETWQAWWLVESQSKVSISASTNAKLRRRRVKEVRVAYFLVRLDVAVILLVLIRSPMYFCKNLLLLSNLSCSSLTASIRSKIINRESCRALACLSRSQQLRGFVSIGSLENDKPSELFTSFLPHLIDILARPSRTHGPHVIGSKVAVHWSNL